MIFQLHPQPIFWKTHFFPKNGCREEKYRSEMVLAGDFFIFPWHIPNQPLWKMMEWVSNSWDDDIPNWMEKIKFFFQTTNQLDTFPIIFPISIGCSMIFPGRIQRVGMCVIVPPSVLCQLRIRCVGDGWNTQAWPSPSPMKVLFWFTNGMIYIKIHLSHALIFCSARSGSST